MRPQSFMQATAFYKSRDVRCHSQTADRTGGAAATYQLRRTLPAPVNRPSIASLIACLNPLVLSSVTFFVLSPFVPKWPPPALSRTSARALFA